MTNEYFTKPEFTRLTLARAEQVDAALQVIEDGFGKLPAPSIFRGYRFNYAEDAGIVNAYVVTLSPVPSAYVLGMTIDLYTGNPNTGPATINVNGLGAVQILSADGSALLPHSIASGQANTLKFDGVAMRLVTSDLAQVQAAQQATALSATGAKESSATATIKAAEAAEHAAAAQSAASGFKWKPSVRAATIGNIALSDVQPIDGVDLIAGDRCLVKDQTDPAENGIYVVGLGVWFRASGLGAWDEIPSATVVAEEGAENGDTMWICTADQGGTLGITPIPWTNVSSVRAERILYSPPDGAPEETVQAALDQRIPFFGSGTALPTSDVGPIWHADYNSLMTWQVFDANGADYTGYASIDVGRARFDTQPTPRPGEVKSNGSSSSNTGFPQLRAWAMHNGLFVPLGDWQQDHLHFADNGDGTFRLPDMRSNFIRVWDDGRGVDVGRVFGSSQLDAMQQITGSYETRNSTGSSYDVSQGALTYTAAAGSLATRANSIYASGTQTQALVSFDSANSPGARTAEETRPRNIALPAPLKF